MESHNPSHKSEAILAATTDHFHRILGTEWPAAHAVITIMPVNAAQVLKGLIPGAEAFKEKPIIHASLRSQVLRQRQSLTSLLQFVLPDTYGRYIVENWGSSQNYAGN